MGLTPLPWSPDGQTDGRTGKTSNAAAQQTNKRRVIGLESSSSWTLE